jgi:predicted RNA binding protein YcfA (HicA-like mRNA interferase family)
MTKRRDLVRELEAAGFRQTGGTKHGKYRRGNVTVMVPRHSEIGDQLAEAIRKQAGLR